MVLQNLSANSNFVPPKLKNNIDQRANLEEAIQSILINSMGERRRNEIDEAIEILRSYLSLETIIETFLTNSNKMLKYFDKKMDELNQIEEELRDRKADITERSNKNDLEQQIEEIRNQQRILRKHRVIIDRILDKLDYLTGTAKEKYITEVHIQILRSDYEQIQRFLTNFYVPLFQRLNSIEAGNYIAKTGRIFSSIKNARILFYHDIRVEKSVIFSVKLCDLIGYVAYKKKI
ncbi:hypothetical protein BpHYR1_024516 [Brachionus plicatilis]|uniref:Uncharacterized protein n=1 Tax=Brachionus plicatilis TaxID=10195 RepID=A0A3M7QB12_BRAPC|nr:hypothetical protein BpHYR1_024516 [Brachionus plicatilis]